MRKKDLFPWISGLIFLGLLGVALFAPDAELNPLGVRRAFAVTAYPPYPASDLSASNGLFMDLARVIWSPKKTSALTYYKIYRSASSDSASAAVLGQVTPPYPPPASLTYDDTSAVPGTLFYYWVRSFNSESDFSSLSNSDAGFSSGDLKAASGRLGDRIVLTWKGSANVAGYELWRDSSLLTQVAVLNSPPYPAPRNFSYEDQSGLQPSVTYTYRIRAYDSQSNRGNFSATATGSLQTGFRVFLPALFAGVGPSIGTTTTTTPSATTTTLAAPLAAPGSLTASTGTLSGKVRLSWSSVAGATLYKVFRGTANNSAVASQVGSSASTTFDDTSAALGSAYYYWVKASNGAGESGFSIVAYGYAALAAPSNLQASQGTSSLWVALSWSSPGGAVLSYRIFRSESSDPAAAQLLGNGTGTSYQDAESGLVPAKAYTYWVKAVFPAGESSFSAAATGYRALAAPTGLSATSNDYCKVALSWSASAGAAGYKIYRSTTNSSSSAQMIGTGTATAYDDKTAVAGTGYYYWVKAYSGSVQSDFSNSATGKKLATAYPVCPAQ